MVILLVAGLFFFSLVFAAQQQQQQLALVQRSFTTPTPDLSTKDYDLLDIILVASVDGKFHALNRTSGATLWSMSSFATTTSVSAPSSLAPLVRTQHVEQNPETEYINDTPLETYIIEPQSGDIYVMSTPTSPLQRFPFSMSELVEISPFTSEIEHEQGERYFIGRKETSLILMELETGRIKATLNSECPFIPDFDDEDSEDVDLDELEGSKPPISAPTEIYIGRTGTFNLFSPCYFFNNQLSKTTIFKYTRNLHHLYPTLPSTTSPSPRTGLTIGTTIFKHSIARLTTIHTYRVYPMAKLLHFKVEPQVKKKMDRTLHSGDNTSTHQCKRLFILLSHSHLTFFWRSE
jgi:hypothetical protein